MKKLVCSFLVCSILFFTNCTSLERVQTNYPPFLAGSVDAEIVTVDSLKMILYENNYYVAKDTLIILHPSKIKPNKIALSDIKSIIAEETDVLLTTACVAGVVIVVGLIALYIAWAHAFSETIHGD